jgi:hypothetical protein
MAEEDQTGTGTITVSDGGVSTAEPAPLVNAEGELREGWRDWLPEDIRPAKVFDRVKNFEGIMRSVEGAERKISADKVPIPNEASTEDEWSAFYEAGGRPKTAADYNLTRPEELPEKFYNQELANAAQELFHKIGISKKQADALFKFNNDNAIALLKQNAQDAEFAMRELVDGLNKDWGTGLAYEQRKHWGNEAIERGTRGEQAFKERLCQKFGNDPDFIRYSSNLGAAFAEAKGVDISKIAPTTVDLQTQIDEMMAKPIYGLKYAEHGFTKKQHNDFCNKVLALREKLTKSVKTG